MINLKCPHCGIIATYPYNLRKHLMGTVTYGGHGLSEEEANRTVSAASSASRREGVNPPLAAPAQPAVIRRGAAAIRSGHKASLALLENTNAIRETLARYERATGHPVYLRPTDKGLTVMSLDPSTPAMVGVGPAGDCCINAVPPDFDDISVAVRAFRDKVAAMTRGSDEERYVIARIRKALVQQLELEEGVVFLHQEWRLPSSGKIDVLALDTRKGQLIVIEAKRSERARAQGREQAAQYVAELKAHANEYLPYLQRLASAMSRIYRTSGEVARIDERLSPRWEVWWPEGREAQPGA